MTAVPLRRNRDFMLLQLGQLLSNAGTQSTAIAYPLLVLAMTGSAAKAGIVSFARALPLALFALPAGVAADRRNRKRLMLT
ncbi:MAG TPA: MFS transporter, partial [Actinomycetota bacterium]